MLSVRKIITSLSIASLGLIYTHCGSDDEAQNPLTSKLSGLQDLPSMSAMAQSNSSAASSRGISNQRGVALMSTGTPPSLMTAAGDPDKYFFHGLISTINSGGSASSTQKNNFWSYSSACWMAQTVGESLARLIEAGTSGCYMKNLPMQDGAITITSGTVADVTKIFSQQAADRTIKFQMSQDGQTEDIFIKVSGTNTVGGNVYTARLYFCKGGSIRGVETISVNKADGSFSARSDHNEEWGLGYNEVTASLKVDSAGKVTFDASKARTAISAYKGEWGTFKGHLTIGADNVMRAKRYNSHGEGTDKNYSIAYFKGSSLKDLAFYDGAAAGQNTWNGSSHNYANGTAFNSTAYDPTTDSSYYTEAKAFDFSDSFFTALTVTAPSFTDDCSATAEIVGTINGDSKGFQTVQTTCEADRFQNYEMCRTEAIQSAEQKIWQ